MLDIDETYIELVFIDNKWKDYKMEQFLTSVLGFFLAVFLPIVLSEISQRQRNK